MLVFADVEGCVDGTRQEIADEGYIYMIAKRHNYTYPRR